MNEPDSIRVEALDERALSKRRRRFRSEAATMLEPLPAEWRKLLSRWVKRGGNSRWETLLKDAGTSNLTLADTLREWLLRQGWAIVIEERKHGGWWPQALELRNLTQLRNALGISDQALDAQRWQEVRAGLQICCDTSLTPALLSLDSLPVHRALARHDLIAALQQWQDALQSGTRRDFALFARNDTKGIGEAEWNWLEQTLDLLEFRIERHAPLLRLRAPLLLETADSHIPLSAAPDFSALSAETVTVATALQGKIGAWRLIENLTSFERGAREYGTEDGVIWLPGFAPAWWKKAVSRLLAFCPAPALIACDPDPAGIEIALDAGSLWQAAGCSWQPWHMDADSLAKLSRRKPLTQRDRQRLAGLRLEELPDTLVKLAAWMERHGEKGEQEGLL